MTNERAYTPSLVLHVLRNPHGWSAEAITAARLQAADEIEQLRADISEAYYLRDKAEGRFCTALMEIDRLRSVLKSVQDLAGGHAIDCQCVQCRIFELLEPIVGNTSPATASEPRVGLTCFQVTDNEMAWKIASQDEPSERRCDCWERISALIVNGPLEGDGLDPTAQRNGIILAANHIAPFNRPAPQGASRDTSPELHAKGCPCPDCLNGTTRSNVEQFASRDASPADLVGALQDVVHTDTGPVRAGKAHRDAFSEFVCPNHGRVQQLTDSGDCPMCYQDRHAQRTSE